MNGALEKSNGDRQTFTKTKKVFLEPIHYLKLEKNLLGLHGFQQETESFLNNFVFLFFILRW